jgi:hypothetical protein
MPLAGVLSLREFVNEGIVRYYNGGCSIYGHCRDVKIARSLLNHTGSKHVFVRRMGHVGNSLSCNTRSINVIGVYLVQSQSDEPMLTAVAFLISSV